MNQPQNNHSCPYKGLQPFTTEDRDYFFGREDEIDIATSNLKVAPLTVLYGASGVGKTSVLMAGVVSRLQSEKEAAAIFFRDWQNAEFVSALRKETLDAIRKVTGNEIEIPEKDSFVDFLTECTKAFPGPLLFILDQFEEYFLYHGPRTNQTRSGQTKLDFDVELARAINRRDLRANFLLSLREDGLSKLDRLQARIPNLLGNLVRLDHLNADSARAAIRKPLVVYNKRSGEAPVKIEKELVEKLLSQVQTGHVMLTDSAAGDAQIPRDSGRIETSFLQLVLERLWLTEAAHWRTEPKAEAHWLRAQTLDDLKGAAHIVRTHLDDVLASLEDLAREQHISLSAQEALPLIAEVFRFLVTSSETKIAHTADDLASFAELEESKRGLLNDVLNLLALPKVRILRKVDPPPGSSGERYEIYHDVLGPAIRDWRIRFVTEQAEARAKAEAERMLAQQRYEAEQKAIAERQEQEKILAQQHQAAEQKAMAERLAQATALAEAERQRAQAEQRRASLELERGKEQAKAARRFRFAAVALALLFLLSVGASAIAFRQSRAATHQADEAGRQRAYADDQAKEAKRARQLAVEQADEAGRARAEAVARAEEARVAKDDAIAKAEEARVARDEAEKQRERADIEKKNALTAKAEAEAARANENAYRKALNLSRRDSTKLQALTQLEGVLENFRKSNDNYAASDVLLNLGDINAELNNDEEAEKRFDKALSLAFSDSDKAWMLIRIGDTYRELPVWRSSTSKKAIRSYNAARDLYRSLKEPVGEANALLGVGYATAEAAAQPTPSPAVPNQPLAPNKDLQTAITGFDEAVKIFHDLHDERNEAYTLWNVGYALAKVGTPEARESAKRYYSRAVPIFEKLEDRKSQIAVLRSLIPLEDESSELHKVIGDLLKIVRLSIDLKDSASEEMAAQELATVYSFQSVGASPATKEELRRSSGEVLKILRRLSDSLRARQDPQLNTLLWSIGQISLELGDYPITISAYNELLERFESSKEIQNQVYMLDALAQVTFRAGDIAKSRDYLKKGKSVLLGYPKEPNLVYLLLSHGYMALEVKDLDAAKTAYDEAIALGGELPEKFLAADALRKTAQAYASHGLMTEALSYFDKLLKHFRFLNQPVGEASVFEDLGRVYIERKEIPKALEYYEQALRIYDQAHSLNEVISVLRAISEGYRTAGDERTAQKYQARADALAAGRGPSPSPSPR